MLKRFPEISTNIIVLDLIVTAVEQVPPSIRSWPRLDQLKMSYFENLKDFTRGSSVGPENVSSESILPQWMPKVGISPTDFGVHRFH